MLSSMQDDLMCEFEKYDNAQEIWLALKDKFGGTLTTKLKRFTIKFDSYQNHQNHTIRQRLKEMSNMIRELKAAEHIMTDEQQVQAVIRSLHDSREHMKVNMSRNENTKKFNNIEHPLEL